MFIALLKMSHYLLQVYLYKIGLHDQIFPKVSSTLDPFYSGVEERNQLLNSVSIAARSVIEEVISLPDIVLVSLPYLHWIQLGHAILILSRLIAAADPLSDVGSLPAFKEDLERLRRRMEDARSMASTFTPPRSLPGVIDTISSKFTEIYELVEAGLAASPAFEEDELRTVTLEMLEQRPWLQ